MARIEEPTRIFIWSFVSYTVSTTMIRQKRIKMFANISNKSNNLILSDSRNKGLPSVSNFIYSGKFDIFDYTLQHGIKAGPIFCLQNSAASKK